MSENTFEVLKRLVEAPSVSGYEDTAREVVSNLMKERGLEVKVDVLGNVIGSFGEGDLKIMIAAHLDTVGFMVTYIENEGYIRFASRGIDQRVVYGQRVVLHTPKGPVYGVVAAKAAHLTKPEERDKVVKIEDMTIDIGAEKKEEVEKLGIKPGTVITPVLELKKLLSNNVLGVGLDDKAGVAAMIKIVDYLAKKDLGLKVYLVATSQEELGLRGARVVAYRIKPDIGIAIDVTHGLQHGVSPRQVAGIKLGKGPAIGLGPNFHPKVVQLLEEAGEKASVPYQREPIFGPSGTDAAVIQLTREGVATGLVSIPLKYMHSFGEIASLNDIENTAKLLAKFIELVEERKKEFSEILV